MYPVILLHGALGSRKSFQHLIPLLPEDYQPQAISFSGHGGVPFQPDFSIDSFARELLDYLDEKGIPKINLFGYSMGGYVALRFAALHTDRVEKAMTLATKFDWTPESAAKECRMLDPEKIEAKVPLFAAELKKTHEPNDWKQLLTRTADLLRDLGANPFLTTENAKNLNLPVRLSMGDRDNMVTLSETIAMFQSLPQASLAVLPDTYHPIEKVNPQRLASAIRDFFEG